MNEVICKIATAEELKALWNYSQSNTYHYFVEGIENDNIEFWALETKGKIIGELYIFWNSPDQEEANGEDRAYLCAFRVSQEFQGLGYGSLLMNRVFDRLLEKGIKEVTIGVDNDDYERLSAMYQKWGFDTLIKTKEVDHHYIGKNGLPSPCEAYNLFSKSMVNKKVELRLSSGDEESLLRLKLGHNQSSFVMPPMKSMLKGKESGAKLVAIDYAGETVGLIMYTENKAFSCYFVWSLMIDHRYQKLGIGSKALEQFICKLSEENKYERITTTVLKGNDNALKLFINNGFVVIEADEEIDLELVIN